MNFRKFYFVEKKKYMGIKSNFVIPILYVKDYFFFNLNKN